MPARSRTPERDAEERSSLIYADDLQEVQLVQDLPRPEDHAGEGIIRHPHLQVGLQRDEGVQAVQEGAPAGHDQPLLRDVGGQLGGVRSRAVLTASTMA